VTSITLNYHNTTYILISNFFFISMQHFPYVVHKRDENGERGEFLNFP
jgi:hypothetical protein